MDPNQAFVIDNLQQLRTRAARSTFWPQQQHVTSIGTVLHQRWCSWPRVLDNCKSTMHCQALSSQPESRGATCLFLHVLTVSRHFAASMRPCISPCVHAEPTEPSTGCQWVFACHSISQIFSAWGLAVKDFFVSPRCLDGTTCYHAHQQVQVVSIPWHFLARNCSGAEWICWLQTMDAHQRDLRSLPSCHPKTEMVITCYRFMPTL